MEDPQATPSAPPAAAAGSGLADNVAGALAYFTFIPAVLFLILPDYNKRPFVRFHAFQCLGLYICAIPVPIPIVGWIWGVVLFVCWIICVVKAYGGEKWKVPVLGNYAEKFANQ